MLRRSIKRWPLFIEFIVLVRCFGRGLKLCGCKCAVCGVIVLCNQGVIFGCYRCLETIFSPMCCA